MAEEQDGSGLSFSDFLERMKDPQAADLVRSIKNFIRHFEERPVGAAVDPEADAARVQAFLAQCEAAFRQHPVWRGCQPEVLDQAAEGLEKYVMSKVWRQTFAAGVEDRERDERYARLMQALGFVDLPTLMGVDVLPDESLLALAQAEVLKMDRYKAPRDKLLCLVNVKTMVEGVVAAAARAGANVGGADAFFPVFLFVVVRSRLPRLASNVEYVKRYRGRPRLSGQFDYMLCNLESAAMYLDTVNYEHLAVSQQDFLGHLAAAGIPEAHLELRRMQQEAEAAAQAQAGAAAATAAAADVAKAAAAGAAAAVARHEQQAAGGAADAADVLAGLQLADGGADGSSGSVGLEPAQTSIPTTPQGAGVAAAAEDGLAREGSLPSLTPLGGAESPVLLEPPGGAAAAGSSPGEQQPRGRQQQRQQQEQQGLQRGLIFEPGPEAQQQLEAQAAAAAAVEAAARCEPYSEPALIEEMVAEGTRHVLAAEAAGALQGRYPFMYARAEDLSLPEVGALLVGYKELLLRYEALSRALQHQLGLGGGGSDGSGADAANGAGTPTAAGPAAAAAASRGHRSKVQQQQAGFGSLIMQGADAGLGAARRAFTAPMQILPGNGRTSPASSSAAGSTEASPSGKWSPGGILQRIASRGARRSQTPPRDRGGDPAAAASAAAAETQQAAGGPAGSPGRGHRPLLNTIFGSPRQQQQQLLQQQQAPASPTQQQQPQQAEAGGLQAGEAAVAGTGQPEPSLNMDDLLQAGVLGSPVEQLQQAEAPEQQAPQPPAAAGADLIQLGHAAAAEEAGAQAAAPGGAAADLLLGASEAAGGEAAQQQQQQQQEQALPPSDDSLI